ncbi:hypothetical protein DPM19_32615 [Actinomadura craniellae]|uniref:DUF4034 domain-containing protein n=1 Tax=Actinomadura craniellae TaxID=2231787 RepID=A0A365GWA6_9ACTN|nr:DUF4034 domain-containing protein [Actinomadura craniellae]RAY11048.1 hypothetical protein DPM19_32615 [Actinomadura craniellae]
MIKTDNRYSQATMITSLTDEERRMGLFNRRKRAVNRATIQLDPFDYDPDAPWLYEAMEKGDWKEARDFLHSLDDFDKRGFYVSLCAEVSGLQDWIQEWIDAEPRSTLPLLVRGAHAVHWAWEARGGAVASQTSDEQFRVFRRRLKLAEDCLDEVVARDPGDATAWSFLVMSARGRGVDRAEAQRRFDAAVRCDPENMLAHSQMQEYLTKKWHGSHEEMFDFARESIQSVPPGSALGVLMLDAHFEQLRSVPAEEQIAYFRTPRTLVEVKIGYDLSIGDPDYRPPWDWPILHNKFLFFFAVAGQVHIAMEQYEVIGKHVTRYPWNLLNSDDPVKAFVELRDNIEAHVSGEKS